MRRLFSHPWLSYTLCSGLILERKIKYHTTLSRAIFEAQKTKTSGNSKVATENPICTAEKLSKEVKNNMRQA